MDEVIKNQLNRIEEKLDKIENNQRKNVSRQVLMTKIIYSIVWSAYYKTMNNHDLSLAMKNEGVNLIRELEELL